MVVAMKQSLDSSVFLKLASVIILQNCLLAHQRMITEYGILPKDMKMSQREIKGVLFAGKSWNFSFVCSIFWFYCEYESRQAIGRAELLSGSCWPFLVWSTQHSTVYSGIVAHSSTLRTNFLTGRLWTVRQSESCGNACFIWFSLALDTLDKKLVISNAAPLFLSDPSPIIGYACH